MMEKFQYQPILPPDEIRMLELIPGMASEPVQVRLIHKSLTDMPQCIALSYEWGAPTREHEIICDCRILKVTESLLKALGRLRTYQDSGRLRTTDQILFWIDAICINQEDTTERSQQVPLMSSIYKNAFRIVVWLGEELADTREAFNLMAPLSEQVDKFDVHMNDENKERYGATMINSDLSLENLSQHRAFDGVMDLFASRSAFMRLWTLQETCLAPSAQITVLCGSVEIPWVTFSNISHVLYRCFRLWDITEKNQKSAILTNIDMRRLIQKETPLPSKELHQVLVASMFVLVSDRRDRVFGVLGLFDEETRATFSNLGYNNGPEEIFQTATESILTTGDGNLNYLIWMHTVREDHGTLKVPSWVWMLDFWQIRDQLPQRIVDSPRYFNPINNPVIQEDTILTCGLTFDTVITVFPNISYHNFEGILLDIHFQVLSQTKSSEPDASNGVFERLKKIYFRRVVSFNKGFDSREQYEGWIARAIIREWERSTGKDDNIDTWRDVSLSKLRKKAALRFDYMDSILLDDMLRRDQNQQLTGQGRNIFVTSKGYYGIGAYGGNGPDCEPAVQPHDKIMILSGVEQPLVLRPCGNSKYKFVGPCFVPGIGTDEALKEQNRGPIEQLEII